MNCEKCGSFYESYNTNNSVIRKRFCSERCRKRAETARSKWRKRGREKRREFSRKTSDFFIPQGGVCKVCGVGRVASRQKYCSERCKKWGKRCWDGGYEITLQEYDLLLEEQGGRCCACNSESELQIDHCHETGKVRGLLCGPCNGALGLARDDWQRLEGLSKYIMERSQLK